MIDATKNVRTATPLPVPLNVAEIRVTYQTGNEFIVRGIWMYDVDGNTIFELPRFWDTDDSNHSVRETITKLNPNERIVGVQGDTSY